MTVMWELYDFLKVDEKARSDLNSKQKLTFLRLHAIVLDLNEFSCLKGL
jgi:hypothetical protein